MGFIVGVVLLQFGNGLLQLFRVCLFQLLNLAVTGFYIFFKLCFFSRERVIVGLFHVLFQLFS